MESDQVAVLLMAYGSPDSLDDVEAYYTHIRGGRTPAPELVDELRERYRLVGERTPLLDISQGTADKLERVLNRAAHGRYRVFLGMKHWHPYIKEAVRQVVAEGLSRVVAIPLAPHYSAMSIGGYYRYLQEAQRELDASLRILPVESWHLHQPYLEAVARRVRERLADFDDPSTVTVIFTAHSLPDKIVANGDPYPDQLRETSERLASMLGLARWTFAYQSAGRTSDPWLGPDLVEVVNHLADEGTRGILVAPIGFVSDHLEILYDIDFEAREAAEDRGVTLRRTNSLNDSDDFVQGLADLVQQRLRQAEPEPAAR